MIQALEDALQRWTRAGILDELTAQRIRRFEAEHEQPAGLRWQVLLAVIFGAILLAAGIALFVAAHWDRLSPITRFLVVMATLIAIHAIAMAVRERFDRLAIVLHGVGTLAAGAAVALVGQIFNIQEHWPAGILLWALCALAGWWLLGDQVQQTIAMVLLPAWIVCEWMARTDGYRGSELMGLRMTAVIAALYLTAFLGSPRKLVAGVLFALGAVVLTVIVSGLVSSNDIWHDWATTLAPPVYLTAFAWGVIGAALLFAWRVRKASAVPAVVLFCTAMVLPYCYVLRPRPYGGGTIYPVESNWVAYLLLTSVAAFLALWGVRERSRGLINYGVLAFALTVLWFYFSNIMDKVGRSLSLILLGVLFLGGGWALEKLRRRMVGQVKETSA